MSLLVFEKGTIGHWLPEGPDVQGNILLKNLSDVQVTSIADGDFIVYDSSQQLWLNTDTIDGGTY